MKFFKLFSILLLLTNLVAFSQKQLKHKVVQGESYYTIAKKYNIKESDIYELNPDAKKTVLQVNATLMVPNVNFKEEKDKEKKSKNKKENVITEVHVIEAGETLYGISRNYEISLNELKELNPDLTAENLKVGGKIIVPKKEFKAAEIVVKKEVVKEVVKEDIKKNEIDVKPNLEGVLEHVVVKNETMFSISKKYGLTVRELKDLNPKVKNSLHVGTILKVNKTANYNNEFEEDTKEPNLIRQSESIYEPQTAIVIPENMSKADFLISKASENVGIRYRSGGTNRNGFDCSGLMISTFGLINMKLPRTSAEQSSFGNTIDRSNARKGDLIFFSTNGRGNINHVGMVTEILEDEIKFIHSSVHAGVIISSTKEEYYAKRFIKLNRVLE